MATRRQPLADRRGGDVRDLHGRPGQHRGGRVPAAHRRQPFGDDGRGDLVADQLPGGQRHRAAGGGMAQPDVRAPETAPELHRAFHAGLAGLRLGQLADVPHHRARHSGLRRRRHAADCAGGAAGELSAGQARRRDGDLRHGRGRRADHRADPRRLDYGQLLLALGVLHQLAGGDPVRPAGPDVRPRPAVHPQRTGLSH